MVNFEDHAKARPVGWYPNLQDIDVPDDDLPHWVVAEDPFEVAVYQAKVREAQLLLSKHRDYGPKNISMSPGGPLNGLAVRLWDKIARLHNLNQQDSEVQFESLHDTGMDIANYGTIATLVIDGEWPT